ncbi:diguanylate phosphodiesterase [Pseudomonas putida]|uniref:diguanylate phosphodiesterase n=1 Tax=Pseudomonas putida TaxID=303 RepID=UPI00226401F3|nr:diguanylate phosphodiesterase [Pseudomonas putida]
MLAKNPVRWMAPALPVFAGKVSTTNLRRSGFTREYGGGGNGERRVEIGQQGRPLRG